VQDVTLDILEIIGALALICAAIFVLLRSAPVAQDLRVSSIAIAVGAALVPIALQSLSTGSTRGGSFLIFVEASAVLILTISILYLGRRFSLVPQYRSLVSTGPYAIVRHPMYGSVFNACRNELQLPSNDTSKCLVPVAEQQGMFIAYASAPGRTASDRGAKSGPYAAALAAELGKSGLDHLNLFQNVKEAVLASTGEVQQPSESNGLARRVYLTGIANEPPLSVKTPVAHGCP